MCGTDSEEKLKNFRSVESGVQIFRARMGEEIYVPKILDFIGSGKAEGLIAEGWVSQNWKIDTYVLVKRKFDRSLLVWLDEK